MGIIFSAIVIILAIVNLLVAIFIVMVLPALGNDEPRGRHPRM